MLEIPGDYLEGGGQILRTAVAFSCITHRPIRIFNIRANRKNPGLKPQHLYTLKALTYLFRGKTKGIELNSKEITFIPQEQHVRQERVEIDLKTAGAIGLALQPLVLTAAFRSSGITFNLKGGTCGLGALPVDYYPEVIFPLLLRSGLKAELKILRRGYYPKGGGQVEARIEPIKEPKQILLSKPGELELIKVISIASDILSLRKVSQRQAERAEEVLKDKFKVPIKIETSYAPTYSPGSQIHLLAYTQKGCILWADARGEKNKSAEKVGEEAAQKLITEIDSQAAVDFHLADNLIPWLTLLGGTIKTSHISLHTQTNIWLCELFFGKIFNLQGSTISCSTNLATLKS